MAFCSNCGTQLGDDFEFCPECGRAITPQAKKLSFAAHTGSFKFCGTCGERMPEDAFYCLSCGRSFDNYSDDFEHVKQRIQVTGKTQSPVVDTSVGTWKNKWVALALCICLGVFGAHRFYEGKKITGFLYLFTYGLLGYGVVVDAIIIATKPNPYRVK